MPDSILTPHEARVVAVLLEKEKTVPDSYPMSLSALVGGCNQKSARFPVMSLTDQDVLLALTSLRERNWVIESSGSRVMRYEHNANRMLQIASNGLILLAVLMLRGPQTVAELRANSQRWYAFADVSSVQAYLEELADRSAGGLVLKLDRQPGAREARWTHLLCGPVELADEPAHVGQAPAQSSHISPALDSDLSTSSRLDGLEARIRQLEAQISTLLRST